MILNDVQLSLLPSGYLIDIINDETSFGTIEPGETVGSTIDSSVLVYVDENSINGSVTNVNDNVLSSDGYNLIPPGPGSLLVSWRRKPSCG